MVVFNFTLKLTLFKDGKEGSSGTEQMYIDKFMYQSCVSYNFVNDLKNYGKKKNNASGLKQQKANSLYIYYFESIGKTLI